MRSNEEWVRDLSQAGDAQGQAIHDLRRLLLQTSLYTLTRHLNDLHNLSPSDRLALAEDCTQEALLTVLNHLADFRGESKFTTWAYKFAVNVSLARARREGWKHISLDHEPDGDWRAGWFTPITGANPTDAEARLLLSDILAVLSDAVRNDLTDRQRMVFRLIVIQQVPMDAVVQRLETNRNSVYKLLHDARKKLKRALQAHGFESEEILRMFGK